MADTFNNFFDSVVPSLDIQIPEKYITDTTDISDPIVAILAKYSSHPSIMKIKSYNIKSSFPFTEVELAAMEEEPMGLDSNKSCISDSIPTKLLKENIDICSELLKDIFNSNIRTSNYDKDLKYADLTPVYKADDTTDKRNYRPISLLSAVSKVFEKIMQKQMGDYMQNLLSPFLCGYGF